MSERCQTVSSSGPYLVQVVSDFRSNEQPGPARPVAGLGPARPGPFSTHYFQAWPAGRPARVGLYCTGLKVDCCGNTEIIIRASCPVLCASFLSIITLE